MQNTYHKFAALKEIIHGYEKVLVAFSGGVDSSFLLKVCADELKENVLAVTSTSAAYTDEEINEARHLASSFHVEHILIETREIENENYAQNPWNRCYFCKTELFSLLEPVAKERNIRAILYGENASDARDAFDIRPGGQAAKESGVHAPLKDAGLTKEEIRFLSKELGLPTYDKPQNACLASRIAFGERITPEKLSRVARAEKFLHDMGFRQVRVRTHDGLARIEVEQNEMASLFDAEMRNKIYQAFKTLGFTYASMDLLGYRTGSSNENIKNTAPDGSTQKTPAGEKS